MKAGLNVLAWGFAIAVIVYMAVGPGVGVLYHNPLSSLGVGLIGLGLMIEGRRKLVTAKATVSAEPKNPTR